MAPKCGRRYILFQFWQHSNYKTIPENNLSGSWALVESFSPPLSTTFSMAAPHLWNKFPIDIRRAPNDDTFKTLVETFVWDIFCWLMLCSACCLYILFCIALCNHWKRRFIDAGCYVMSCHVMSCHVSNCLFLQECQWFCKTIHYVFLLFLSGVFFRKVSIVCISTTVLCVHNRP